MIAAGLFGSPSTSITGRRPISPPHCTTVVSSSPRCLRSFTRAAEGCRHVGKPVAAWRGGWCDGPRPDSGETIARSGRRARPAGGRSGSGCQSRGSVDIHTIHFLRGLGLLAQVERSLAAVCMRRPVHSWRSGLPGRPRRDGVEMPAVQAPQQARFCCWGKPRSGSGGSRFAIRGSCGRKSVP